MRKGEPSTCLLDTLIVPLPSFLFLAFLVVYIPIKCILQQRSRTKRASYASSKLNEVPDSFDAYAYAAPIEVGGTDKLPTLNWRAEGTLPQWAHYLYVVLIVCLLGLRILELARLVAAKMGLGLLPVNVIANIVVIAILLCPTRFACLSLRMGRRRELGLALVCLHYLLYSLKKTRIAKISFLGSRILLGVPNDHRSRKSH